MTDPITALKSHVEQAQREMDANQKRQEARGKKYQEDDAELQAKRQELGQEYQKEAEQDAREHLELKGFVERSQEFFRTLEADKGSETPAGEVAEEGRA